MTFGSQSIVYASFMNTYMCSKRIIGGLSGCSENKLKWGREGENLFISICVCWCIFICPWKKKYLLKDFILCLLYAFFKVTLTPWKMSGYVNASDIVNHTIITTISADLFCTSFYAYKAWFFFLLINKSHVINLWHA